MNGAALGHHGRNPPRRRFQPAGRALGKDLASRPAQVPRHGRHRNEGFGPAVIDRVERAQGFLPPARHQCLGLRSREKPGFQVKGRGVALKPALVPGQILLGVSEIGNARFAVAGLGPHGGVHLAPLFQRNLGQRHLARVTPLLAHPAPVAARLLGGNLALLQHHHIHPALAQLHGGGNADDAAANHHHARALRQLPVAFHPFHRNHDALSCSAAG